MKQIIAKFQILLMIDTDLLVSINVIDSLLSMSTYRLFSVFICRLLSMSVCDIDRNCEA